VILLADVFENYRETSLMNYNLDPVKFPSAPSLSWNAFLKYTGVSIQLPGEEIIRLVSSNMRGGICSSGDLYYANVYEKPNEWIYSLDMNNLYGKAMMYPMPIGDYEEIHPDDMT